MCTSVAFGTAATAGNLLILARNEDFTRPNWNKYLAYRPVPQYALPGTTSVTDGRWTLGNGLVVPVPANSFSYSCMPDAAADTEASHNTSYGYFFEERGVNARNVAITATNSMATNARAAAADPFVAVGIQEAIITTLILPQAETARHGVELLGGYVEQFGASEGNGVLIGDQTECWYVEIGSAHHWIAVRVPDDQYLVVANDMRVHDVDLDAGRAAGTLMYSDDLFEFVEKYQLLENPDRRSFNFAQAFGVTGVPYNVDRVWLAQHILTPSIDQQPRQAQYPLFLAPDQPAELGAVMGLLRATYAGTVLDGKADRPIGYDKTAESHIITFDPAMPDELAGQIWQTVSTPLGAPYLPLYSVMTDIPASYRTGLNEFTQLSAYWAFHGAHTLAKLAAGAAGGQPEWWVDFEQRLVRQAPVVGPALADVYRTDPGTAVDMARRYSTGTAAQAYDLATRATDDLLTAIAAGGAQAHAEALA